MLAEKPPSSTRPTTASTPSGRLPAPWTPLLAPAEERGHEGGPDQGVLPAGHEAREREDQERAGERRPGGDKQDPPLGPEEHGDDDRDDDEKRQDVESVASRHSSGRGEQDGGPDDHGKDRGDAPRQHGGTDHAPSVAAGA
jgi:hypothetical protein